MYTWSENKAKITEFSFNEKYGNGRGKFESDGVSVSFNVNNKAAADIIMSNRDAEFTLTGTGEKRTMKDGSAFLARVLGSVMVDKKDIAEEGDDEIPF